jgi:hypothetical protein
MTLEITAKPLKEKKQRHGISWEFHSPKYWSHGDFMRIFMI